jgi:molybdate transport system regulatory protein
MTTSKTKAAPKSKALAVSGGLWLDRRGRSFLGGRRIELLEAIEQHGSITQAAKAVGLSYKGAWDAVDAVNNMAEKPLVLRAAGGQHGGGSHLTDYGRHVVQLYRQLESGHQRVLTKMQQEIHDPERLNNLLRVLTLKTSARNQLRGTIKSVRKGAVNADVVLELGDGLEIFANITNEAVEDLALKRGREAIALIKSSFVLLSPDPNVRVSARNRLAGTVTSITRGSVNSEVKLSLAGGRTLAAIVTNEGIKELGLEENGRCCAIIKASHVLVAVND